jgi:Mn2+/Fe2+ NRAMP family transporter
VLSPKRRRTILRGALGLALAMALMLIVFNLARSVYLNALPAGVDHSAAQAVYNQLLSFLRLSLRTLFVFGVVVALAAWLSGPGELATRIRTGGRDLVRRAPGEGVVSPKVAASVDRYRTALRGSAVGIGLAILVALTAPGPLAVLVIAILVLLVLAVIELLRRGAAQPARPSAKSPGTG